MRAVWFSQAKCAAVLRVSVMWFRADEISLQLPGFS
jgi:hypothetical protein